MNYINLSSIIAQSEIRFLRNLPLFIIKLFARIIHLDKINNTLGKYKDSKGADFHNAVLNELKTEVEYIGMENLPDSSRCFFVANHPFGILDGLMLTKMLLEKYGNCKAIGNAAFNYIPQLSPYVLSSSTDHNKQKEFALEMESIFASDLAISHFPAGYVSRYYKGKIQDIQWKKTFITKAITHKRDIVPMYFKGRNSRIFYTVNILRRLVGIKMNIELILLPHELFNKKNKKYSLIIGEAVSYTTLDKSKTHQEWADEFREKVYALKNS